MSVGAVSHEKLLRSIELMGTKVVPAVRQALAAQGETPVAAGA